MTKRKLCSFIVALALPLGSRLWAQVPQQWIGEWKGMMHIYRAAKVVDSVAVSHIIQPGEQEGTYVWRTEYHSPKMPMVKDYKLRSKDVSKGLYLIDEGEGLELTATLLGPRLMSTFEIKGALLTANYEFREEELIFEVTSNKKDSETGGGVTNYIVSTLQRAVFKRIPKER